jgi:hypothetical protein
MIEGGVAWWSFPQGDLFVVTDLLFTRLDVKWWRNTASMALRVVCPCAFFIEELNNNTCYYSPLQPHCSIS